MKNKKFTKADLKVGYVVKMRDGSLNMVMPTEGGELVAVDKNQGWMSINGYDDCLCVAKGGRYITTRPEYDIVEVYGFCKFGYETHAICTDDRELLWKREPEKSCDQCAHKVVCTHVGMCGYFMPKAE